MAAANGANPVLVVRRNLPEHIAELEARAAKLVADLRDTHQELAVARSLAAVVPAEELGAPEPGA